MSSARAKGIQTVNYRENCAISKCIECFFEVGMQSSTGCVCVVGNGFSVVQFILNMFESYTILGTSFGTCGSTV